MIAADVAREFPLALDAYPPAASTLWATLATRASIEPFNVVATGIFVVAIVHTFAAARIAALAHRLDDEYRASAARDGRAIVPNVAVEALHFLGEVEVVFGLWAVVLLAAMIAGLGWQTATHYFDGTVNYTEPIFVVVIMALAATRPIVGLAENALRRIAGLGGCTPAAWWLTILTVGPLLGSFITEPAAMTICALLLSRQFFDLGPGTKLKFATLGVLFVNVSIGGTLTHFAAPPVLMVARVWNWDTPFMLAHFGVAALAGIVISTLTYFAIFQRELRSLGTRASVPDVERPDEEVAAGDALLPVPAWVTICHVLFMVWTVVNAHHRALFVLGFLFFLGFARATAAFQSRIELRTPLLVGFFLAGLVIHGGLQGWWIAPVLRSLSDFPLFLGATVLTAFNDNALITYLATLVPDLSAPLRASVVEGAVLGGGLTVIANAPNPAGQAILARFFGGAVHPIGLLAGAVLPTVISGVMFRTF